MTDSSQHKNQSVIISETDLHGTIVFVNDAFCDISGFSKQELIGSPHNIIRHPTMPKELFRILWTTIRKGEIFRGVIKNKTKFNKHYWVNATIMPMFEGGKVIRYLGARHFIVDDLVAEDLFKIQATKLKLINRE